MDWKNGLWQIIECPHDPDFIGTTFVQHALTTHRNSAKVTGYVQDESGNFKYLFKSDIFPKLKAQEKILKARLKEAYK